MDLSIKNGEVHAIMGPNGSGKSTLANCIAGKEHYHPSQGEIIFDNQTINNMPIEERSHKGIFLGFQYPVEIPGVNNIYFLKTALNEKRKHMGLPPIDAMEFMSVIEQQLKLLKMDKSLLYRAVNQGFSGGEKKRNEILQMLVLEPKLAVLDETDSGLDIDALRIISQGINSIRNKDRSILLITHYQRLLDYIQPDYIHILVDGRIVKSGDKHLAAELETSGYENIREENADV